MCHFKSLECSNGRDDVQCHLMVIDVQEADNVLVLWQLLDGLHLIVHGLELSCLGEHFNCHFCTLLLHNEKCIYKTRRNHMPPHKFKEWYAFSVHS